MSESAARPPRRIRRLTPWLGLLGAVLLHAGPVQAARERSRATPARPAPVAPLPMPSAEVLAFLDWRARTGDNEGRNFVVIDKRAARLWLFDGQGRPLIQAPVLIGQARGDASVPGIGERPVPLVLPHERTTPAGRFVAEAGRNAQGEDVFWVDYDAAVSMHRVRTTHPEERRLQRLASPTAADNRISYGCINVPAEVFDRWLQPRLKGPRRTRGIVYVLPETQPMAALFTPASPGFAARGDGR